MKKWQKMFLHFAIKLNLKAKKFMKMYEKWLYKARNDLEVSIVLIGNKKPLLDTAIYHAQQSGEKALKAFLSYKKKPLIKTQDVVELTEIYEKIDLSFSIIFEYAKNISPVFRYPDDILDPDLEDVKQAIVNAKKILVFVENKINE